jgi:thiamine biosynthesis lipoprotein
VTVREHELEVEVFGGKATIHVGGRAPDGTTPQLAAALAAAQLRLIHAALTRFDPCSELSRLNADRRTEVPASPLVRRLAGAVREAGECTGGLVDATILPELVSAGYGASRVGVPAAAGARRPTRPGVVRAATADSRGRWREVTVAGDRVVRPPGVQIDGGGLVKGMACDLVARRLERHPLYAIDCSGDLRMGGTARRPREVTVKAPFAGEPPARWSVSAGAAATSGVHKRSWTGADGRSRHHLIDPGRGEPAETGVVQATALAPTGLEAEIRAKAALLAGPAEGLAFLVHGGVLVTGDGRAIECDRREAA